MDSLRTLIHSVALVGGFVLLGELSATSVSDTVWYGAALGYVGYIGLVTVGATRRFISSIF